MNQIQESKEKNGIIVTFLSDYKNNAEWREYTSLHGKVKGKETNDAPIRYLLENCEGISEIYCIVSEKVRTEKRINTDEDGKIITRTEADGKEIEELTVFERMQSLIK